VGVLALLAGVFALHVSGTVIFLVAAACIALRVVTWISTLPPEGESRRYPNVLTSVDEEPVSPELTARLYAVFDTVQHEAVDLASLRSSLRNLLTFLESTPGRTNANCVATDEFFLDVDDEWSPRWVRFPAEYQDILECMGSDLHDSASPAKEADAVDNTPKQLLQRLERLEAAALHA